ncbi:MAG TPA: sigma-54-dependent Fis family transcriptional regulator [Deltaproteobacteria bacterium]|nr:sigma-54-dependent Fis family transcriptional regulator [Deltaproteobacteria bacterium]
MKIAVVDDEKIKRITLTDSLIMAGHEAASFEEPVSALEAVKAGGIDLVVTDLKLPVMSGMELLRRIKEHNPDLPVIVMTAYATVDTAVEAMKLGAYDYITKPFTSEELMLIIERLSEYRALLHENIELKRAISERYSFGNLIGKSKEMQNIYDLIESISTRDATVLIVGESGTGKELIAHAIHYNSLRKHRPLIKFSCAALTETLLLSELFGHEKGAFTGAVKERKGRFELADGGTIFLDDVDDIPLPMQTKLLRVLQEKEFERVGGTTTIKVDVRVIAATKVDLLERVREGRFREDLYYRFNVIPLKLPPLRGRKEDIPLLIEHFVDKYSKGEEDRKTFSSEALRLLMDYGWPGNVRELENMVERILAMTRNPVVEPSDLPDVVFDPGDLKRDIHFARILDSGDSFDEAVSAFEKRLITMAIKKAGGNRSEAARMLKLKRSTLQDKVVKYGIHTP